jgi:hypothetical protein
MNKQEEHMTETDHRSKAEKLGELERMGREVDAQAAENEATSERIQRRIEALILEEIDEYLGPLADKIVADVKTLLGMLVDLGLIDSQTAWKPRYRLDVGSGELVDGIEADHPDGRRLYVGRGADTIIAVRRREGGRFEFAKLDEYGMPIKWHADWRPDLN